MCMISNVGDDWNRTFPERHPYTPWTPDAVPNKTEPLVIQTGVSQEEFDAWKAQNQEEFEKLRAEILALKELLKAAKIYDEATGQVDCENAEKIALIEEMARRLDVDLKDVFGEKKSV